MGSLSQFRKENKKRIPRKHATKVNIIKEEESAECETKKQKHFIRTVKVERLVSSEYLYFIFFISEYK